MKEREPHPSMLSEKEIAEAGQRLYGSILNGLENNLSPSDIDRNAIRDFVRTQLDNPLRKKSGLPEQDPEWTREVGTRYRVVQIDQWNDGRVTETILGENLTEEAARKIDHGAISAPDDSRSETTTRLEKI